MAGTVETITAFLFHRGGHDDPARLAANAGKSFIGSIVLGMGFTFDDTDTKGVATSLAEMRRLIEDDARTPRRSFHISVARRSTRAHVTRTTDTSSTSVSGATRKPARNGPN